MSSEPYSAPLSSSHTALGAKIRACLLGGALGDALGTAGPERLEDTLSVSSATQLALYSLDGLLEAVEWANSGVGADETACIWLAYLRWLRGRGIALPETGLVPLPRPIDAEELLHPTPAGTADAGTADAGLDPEVVSALSSGEMGTRQRPVNTESDSPAALVRSAPFGLLPYVPTETVYKLVLDAASLTHGHPAARHASAVFAATVHGLLSPGTTLAAAAEKALAPADAAADSDGGVPGLADRLRSVISGPDFATGGTAASGAAAGGTAAGGTTSGSGATGGTTAEGALTLGLSAALRAENALARQAAAGAPASPEDTVTAALREAAAAGGAPAAVVAGSLLGALYGVLPGPLLASLRERAAVERLADSYVSATIAP
ncbi:ADP-ribosylglycohydrolase family protein [Arthrobacter zhangbolii]|uniref:ADP-ribosylglycohydrolase family protein n=1 Tax=Arthrobacter zhangbolii TaxID=2886936 RepID=A0ABY4DJM6_9MICC|nr:ADP-ribosylglycohydrolase family protein [Arthrobacter zhangbolii]UON91132.1 ADP-ribosylglycohydrolase family protein [Arthrobacter zhangbolii]